MNVTAPRSSLLQHTRVIVLGAVTFALISATAVVLLLVAGVTVFRTRRLYARVARVAARTVLRVWSIRLVVHQDRPFPAEQTVYISNHTSTLDLFVLMALGLPNTRFFLSGFLRKVVPLGVITQLIGTFFTVPQHRPAERVRIFQRADRTLRRTGESVYLSPEGGRIVTGQIGHFNKGAFHLATSLGAPIVPLYFKIPPQVDPGRGYDARPGTVHVHVKRPVDTSRWRLEDLEAHTGDTRQLFVGWHREHQGADHEEPSNASHVVPVTAH